MNQTSSRRSVRPWYVILLAAVAAGVIVFGVTQLGTSTASTARTSKEDVTAQDGVVQTTVSGSGEVEPGVDDTLNFGTSGTLQAVDVKVGEHVKKGQLIAALDPSSAELTLEEAQASLTEAQDNLTEVENGDSTGSSSSGSSNGSSTGSSSSSAGVTASAAAAGGPSSSGAGSTGESGGSTSKGTGSATKGSGSATTGSGSATTGSGSATKGAGSTSGSAGTTTVVKTVTVTTTTPKTTPTASALEQAKVQVQQAQATVTADQKAVDETKLYAPATGTIASLSSDSIGASVSSGSASSGAAAAASSAAGTSSSSSTSSSSGFAELINDHTMTMTVSLSEDDISSVKVGQIATVSITALSGVELAGHVTSISPLGSDSSGVVSYDATLTITQSNPKVLPGMSATATIVTGQAQGVTVENDAITGSGSDASVQLVKGGKVVSQPVVVGLKGSSRSQIVSGLKSGQEVQVTITLPALGASSSTSSTTSSSSPTGGFGGGTGGFGGGAGFRALFGGAAG